MILGGLLLIAGIGIAKSLTAKCVPNIQAGSRVFLVGDSLGVGIGPYLKKLCTGIGADFAATTQISTTASFWVGNDDFKSQIAAFQPTLTIVSLGTNDTAGNTPVDQLSTNIANLLAIIQATGSAVLWVLPPTMPFPDRFSALVRAQGVPVFESAQLDIPRDPNSSPPGVHPTIAGYAGWAGLIWQSATCSTQPPDAALSGLGRLRFLPLAGMKPRKSTVMARLVPTPKRRRPAIIFHRG